MSQPVQRSDALDSAAKLLVDIAGPDPVHIEMSARGPKKYYDVHRPLDERDAHAHLLGYKTKGATLRNPDGKTRALCYDADTLEDWQHLLEGARTLAAQGYLPLLEASPVDRGGHCWIIFTEMVCAEIAQHCLLSLAPTLQQVCEYWPRSTQKVRLPAGKYVKPGYAAWCTLTDAQGSTLSTDGLAAAPVLLAYQTTVELIPKAVGKHHEGGSGAELASKTDRQKTRMQARDRVGMGPGGYPLAAAVQQEYAVVSVHASTTGHALQ